jgi:uncharacterized membrane protein
MSLAYYYLTIFIIYWFLWWIVDTFFHSLHSWKLKKWWIFLYWPFSMIYSIPLVLINYLLNTYNWNEYLFILVAAIWLTIWEYIWGVILEKLFNKKFWDYSDKKFNLNWKICLEMSIIWWILIFVFIKFLNPLINWLVIGIPISILEPMIILLYVLLVVDFIFSIKKNLKKASSNP